MSSLNKVRLEDGTVLSVAEWLHQPVFSSIEFSAAAANAGAIDLTAFNYVVGQRVSSQGTAIRNATEADTNLVRKKAMNQDESLIVFAITYEVYALNSITGLGSPANDVLAVAPIFYADGLRLLQQQALVQLFVGANIKKPQVEVPFAFIHQSVGAPAWESIFASDPASANNMFSYGTGGVISARNQELLRLPVYIGGFGENARPGNMMTFSLKFTTPVGFVGGATNSNGLAGQTLLQGAQILWHLDGLKKRPA